MLDLFSCLTLVCKNKHGSALCSVSTSCFLLPVTARHLRQNIISTNQLVGGNNVCFLNLGFLAFRVLLLTHFDPFFSILPSILSPCLDAGINYSEVTLQYEKFLILLVARSLNFCSIKVLGIHDLVGQCISATR